MGYTHYWRAGRGIKPAAPTPFLEAVRKVLADPHAPKVAFDCDETDKPAVVEPHLIRFNGLGDEGHETFYLDLLNPEAFSFCKTACKPYDVLVVAVLTLAHHFDPDWLSLSSDGDAPDWEEGVALARSIVPEVKNPLAEDDEDEERGGPQACPMCASSSIHRSSYLDEGTLQGHTCEDCDADFWTQAA